MSFQVEIEVTGSSKVVGSFEIGRRDGMGLEEELRAVVISAVRSGSSSCSPGSFCEFVLGVWQSLSPFGV